MEKNDGDVVDVKQNKSETNVVPASYDTYSVNDERQMTDTEADLPTSQLRNRTSPVLLKTSNLNISFALTCYFLSYRLKLQLWLKLG